MFIINKNKILNKIQVKVKFININNYKYNYNKLFI